MPSSKVELFDGDAGGFQARDFVGGCRNAVVGVLGHDDDVLQTEADHPIDGDDSDHGVGGRSAEDVVGSVCYARRPAFVFDDAIGGDVVVPGSGEERRDLVLLRDFHHRQGDCAMITADHAMHAVFEDPALSQGLAALGDAFGIAGDDFQPMVDAGNINAAIGVDVGNRLLVSPVNDDAGACCARWREWSDAAEQDRFFGEVAMAIPKGDGQRKDADCHQGEDHSSCRQRGALSTFLILTFDIIVYPFAPSASCGRQQSAMNKLAG